MGIGFIKHTLSAYMLQTIDRVWKFKRLLIRLLFSCSKTARVGEKTNSSESFVPKLATILAITFSSQRISMVCGNMGKTGGAVNLPFVSKLNVSVNEVNKGERVHQ